MSELTERLFDHRWDDLTIPESKMLRNECGNHIEAMEKAIAIYCREAQGQMEFTDDEEAVTWFMGYADAVEAGTDEEYLAKTPEDFLLEAIAKDLGVSVEDLKQHPQFGEIMEHVKMSED